MSTSCGAVATRCYVSECQEVTHGVLRQKSGELPYAADGNQWLTREAWIERYGRKKFRLTFGNDSRYDHAQELGMVRTDILQSVKLICYAWFTKVC